MRLTEEQYRTLTGAKAAKPAPRPRPENPHEADLARQLEEAGVEGWRREHEFHARRKWRLDFAWPRELVALEVEGGVHRVKDRFSRDVEKYNVLALDGWLLLRATPRMVASGKALELARAALKLRRSVSPVAEEAGR